jgi:hypothetical protein
MAKTTQEAATDAAAAWHDLKAAALAAAVNTLAAILERVERWIR